MTFKLRSTILASFLAFALALGGCSSAKKKNVGNNDASSMQTEASSGDQSFELNADSDSGKASSFQSVSFAYNSSTLTSATREILQKNASVLKANPSVEIQIEGHCDERGGVQYNLALGEKRARVVKNYLSTMGVSSRRLSTISFGKERPVSFGHDEGSWGQNRRANFVITAK